MTCRFEQQGGLCRGRGPTRPSDAKAAASPQQCRGGAVAVALGIRRPFEWRRWPEELPTG